MLHSEGKNQKSDIKLLTDMALHYAVLDFYGKYNSNAEEKKASTTDFSLAWILGEGTFPMMEKY